MRFEVLKRSNLKRNIIIGVVVVAIIIVCIITLTRAKYRSVASTTLIKGEVNYTLADLNLVAVYLQDDDKEGYTQDKEIPTSGYYLNTEESYCEVNDTRSDSISLSYDMSFRTLTVSPITTQGTKCYLYFDQGTLLRDAILADNGTPKTNPNLSATSCKEGTNSGSNCDVEENGIYEGEDDYGTTYYYRGTVDNNWVSFAGFYWRIIRINGDGTVRLIYNGTSPTATGSGTQLDEESVFNSVTAGEQLSYHVGYMYTESDNADEGQHGTTTSSTIKERLDAWYVTNIEDKGLTKYIADSGFCGNREVANGYSWVSENITFYYVAYDRRTGTPTFECSKEDLYTVDSDKGNEALTYAIGLITLDEVRYAGAYYTTSNTGYWLYTDQYYWTMSPFSFSSSGYAYMFVVRSTDTWNGNSDVNVAFGVRPVINLSADVTISEGDGTAENPYIVNNS